MAEFRMPSLGADMESGTLVEWLVKPGDHVHRGDVIAVVGTEKGEIEIEVFQEGVVEQLVVGEGTQVPVQAVVALIQGEGEAAPMEVIEKEKAAVEEKAVAKEKEAASVGAPAAPGVPTPPAAGRANGHRIRVSPLARKLAEELGVNLDTVQGSGSQGAISRADVEQAAAQRAAAPVEAPGVKPTVPAPGPATDKGSADFQAGMRRAIALAMSRANRDIPHYYLQTRIDMSHALKWLETENTKRSITDRVLPVVLLIKAVAQALTKVPDLNGYWMDEHLHAQEAIHIGFAIALRQGGLVTPALHHVDLKDMDQLMADLRDLIMRTRAGRLRSSEMTDATITVTTLGDLGVETVYGVIYPPQVALVGYGKIADQVWVEDGMLGVRPVLTATIAGDHRATDGRIGAQFLDELTNFLQKPETLWA